ncbi:hypothetical protein BDA96_03G185600 [Sorghum bicolor]|uniref:DOG1 domain-containing protein n=1 Tax=Sorghum bicolor TaxID=4558 RepID=A0A921UQC9_SORBI|nr:hypothetical protein BDA96_03G185600 [Sorghum bicolor]
MLRKPVIVLVSKSAFSLAFLHILLIRGSPTCSAIQHNSDASSLVVGTGAICEGVAGDMQLHQELAPGVDDLSERLSELLATSDMSSAQAAVIRSLLM